MAKSKPMQKIANDSIFDKRALIIGAVIAAAGLGVALVWRTTTKAETTRRPEEFQFSLAEHSTEKFELKDPIRQFNKEQPADSEVLPASVTKEERPDIHITETPTNVESTTEVIKSKNVEFNTQKIEVSSNTNVDVVDAPLEISQVSETTTYALNVVAANTMGAADIFKYDTPSPRDRMQAYHINAAPRAGRASAILPKAFGDQDAPSMGKLGPANINLFGTGDFFRTMDRTGVVRSRSAVDSALHWLATNQDVSGLWLAEKFDGEPSAQLADTALSCLALMGGGNTTAKGEYRRNVLRGLEAIIKHQNEKGLISAKGSNLYTHAICTIALCEAYGRAKDPRLLSAAQKAVDFCQVSVAADGGWRYQPNAPASDTSVTAWFIQALKAAKMAGISYKSSTFSQALVFVDSVTDENAGPNSNGIVRYVADRNEDKSDTKTNSYPSLTCAAMMIRRFSSMGPKSPILIKAADITRERPPVWKQKDFYYWYYATYAMHNMGGEYRIWWNAKIRDVLLEHQAKDGENAGSWDPKDDRWAKAGGRVYTTALGALCLEVYYRYSDALDSFGSAPDIDELFLDSK